MSETTTRFGIVAVGRMGGGIARQALAPGFSPVASAHRGVHDELAAGLVDAEDVAGFGGHSRGRDEGVARERRKGRVGPLGGGSA